MAPEFIVRNAGPDDMAILPELEAAADTIFELHAITPLPAPGTPAELAAALVVLVVGDPPTGFARIDHKLWGPHLEQLSVHPDHGRRGIGRALLRSACQWAKDSGHHTLTLATFRDVPWNGRFYASEGFVTEGPVDEWYAAHGEPPEDPVMARLGARILMSRPL